jgi:hypothetical protein
MAEPRWMPLDEIDVTGAVQLIVAWPRGDSYESGYVKISKEVGDHLRIACKTTISQLQARKGRKYFADMALDREEYLHLKDENLVSDSAVADAVLPAGRVQTITSRSLPERALALYAAVIGQAEDRIAFVRKTNPRAGVRSGLLVTSTSALARSPRQRWA